jgi:hypothetical protein
MNRGDPIDVHRALQKAARELAHYADHGRTSEYLDAIDRLESKLQAVRRLSVAPLPPEDPEEFARRQAID